MLARPFKTWPLLLLLQLAASHAEASFGQQGTKLVGTGAVGAASQGRSVAVSADGNTAVVGGGNDNSGQGAAWVFVRSAGVWSQQGVKLVGTGAVGAANLGWSVAMSADGNTVIVGGNNDNGGQGAAWVFVRSAGAWSQQGSKLVGTGSAGLANQGWSVALSGDGNTAIVGGINDNGAQGAAWVFVRSAGLWSQQGAKLAGTGSVGSAQQGISVALSADGNTAVVGGNGDNSLGAVWIFVRSGGVWSQQGAKLVGTGALGQSNEGYSAALSSDGNTAVFGGPADNNNLGAAWVFVRSSGVWSQQGPKLMGTGAVFGYQGVSVALSGDGNTAAVGGNADNSGQGAVWVFGRNAGVWSQPNAKLVGVGAAGAAAQGTSVAVSADGNTMVVGGNSDNSAHGAAWVFIQAQPLILSIKDVPNDQGGQVRLRWQGSPLDLAGAGPQQITSYGVWRRIPPGMAMLNARMAPARVMNDTLGTSYDFVTSVAAVQSPSYNMVAPTLADSSFSGFNRFTFLVTAHTADPNIFFISPADSGYSVDNLPPAIPAPFTAAYASSATHLHWGPNAERDFWYYKLYRGTSSGFTPGSANLIATLGDTGYVDPGPAGGYYKLSAVDVHGNESGFALVTPAGTSGVEGASVPPVVFLAAPRPNPARDGAALRFGLPRAATAWIGVYDVNGRLVRELARTRFAAGEHGLGWDLRDDAGAPVAGGLFFVRLSAAGVTRSVRLAVVR